MIGFEDSKAQTVRNSVVLVQGIHSYLQNGEGETLRIPEISRWGESYYTT